MGGGEHASPANGSGDAPGVTMKYRKLGRSGLKISEISLGGWTTFAASVRDPETIRTIVSLAFSAGVNFFDMADVYASGEAERQIGAVLSEFPRHHLVLSSKVYFPMSKDVNDRGLSRKHVHESVRQSLRRLQTDYLDLYFAHRYDSDVSVEEVVRAFSDLVSQGLVLYWGTSEWPAAAIQEAIDVARSNGWHPPTVEQAEYSLLHRHRAEQELFPSLGQDRNGRRGVEPPRAGPPHREVRRGDPRGHPFRPPATVHPAPVVREECPAGQEDEGHRRRRGLTRAQLALAWVLTKRHVTSAITGATRVEQLEENLKAGEAQLTPETVSLVEELFPSSAED